jgi:hypothetical protein
LLGTRMQSVLATLPAHPMAEGLVPDTDLPRSFVRWVIEHEFVERLGDLVERRLMLLYDRRLSRRTLQGLAQLLSDSGKLPADQVPATVDDECSRLREHFGKPVAAD